MTHAKGGKGTNHLETYHLPRSDQMDRRHQDGVLCFTCIQARHVLRYMRHRMEGRDGQEGGRKKGKISLPAMISRRSLRSARNETESLHSDGGARRLYSRKDGSTMTTSLEITTYNFI